MRNQVTSFVNHYARLVTTVKRETFTHAKNQSHIFFYKFSSLVDIKPHQIYKESLEGITEPPRKEISNCLLGYGPP